jgi:large subunit ribosomal protein L29
MKASELKAMSKEDLQKELLETRRELFNFRVQKATSQLTRTHLVRNAKKTVARIKTVLKEKETAGA